MMNSDGNSWPDIEAALIATQDLDLARLLDSSDVTYNGAYQLSAPPRVYASLCRYYPMIETVVQDLTGKQFQLALSQTVPMGTLPPDSDEAVDEGLMSFDLSSADVTEAILAPESIAAIPSYTLRFVPYVGSSAVLIASALRQAFYRRSREHGADQLYPRQGDAVTIDVDRLLQMLGRVFSRATFFRVFKSGAMDWFVRRADPVHRFVNGKVIRQANTYTYRGLLLTPGDAQDLFEWLVKSGATEEPAEALKLAIETPRDQILTFPYRVPDPLRDKRFDSAVSVHEVLQSVMGASRLTPALAGLCDRLSVHLIRPESFLAVPWYWFHRVLPDLGADLGVLYLMSKNCCYIDWARGKDRSTFWVSGGMTTLQKWIGSETLPARIPHQNPSSRGRPRKEQVSVESQYTRDWRAANRKLASQYLCRVATRAGNNGTDWQLRVEEVRLTASDEILKGALYSFLLGEHSEQALEVIRAFSAEPLLRQLLLSALRLDPVQISHYETLVKHGICHSETLAADQICHFDTLADSLNCHFETLVRADICQFDTIIKILIRLKDSALIPNIANQPDTIADQSTAVIETNGVVGYFTGAEWDFGMILERINPKLRERLLAPSHQSRFISWLIYGCLTDSIHSPLSFAVSRALESASDAGGPAVRLAALPAAQLAGLLWDERLRVQAGYIGRNVIAQTGAEDLEALLLSAPDSASRSRLLQRALDALGVRAA